MVHFHFFIPAAGIQYLSKMNVSTNVFIICLTDTLYSKIIIIREIKDRPGVEVAGNNIKN